MGINDQSFDPDSLMTTREVAEFRKCSIQTIQRERQNREGIPFIQLSYNSMRYRRRDVLEWIEAHRVETS